MPPDAHVTTFSSQRRGRGRHYEELTLIRPPLSALQTLWASTLSLANRGSRHAAHLFQPFTG